MWLWCVAIIALNEFFRSIILLRVNAGISRENSGEASKRVTRIGDGDVDVDGKWEMGMEIESTPTPSPRK